MIPADEIKIGDAVYCRKTLTIGSEHVTDLYIEGNYYIVEDNNWHSVQINNGRSFGRLWFSKEIENISMEMENPDGSMEIIYPAGFLFTDYFYTNQQLREIKLKKINSSFH